MLADLKRFKVLISCFDVNYEKQNIDNVDRIPLIVRLDEISKLRINYIKFIELLKLDNYMQLKNLFLVLSKEWEKCKLHFVKLFLSNRDNIKINIEETISEIIKYEQQAVLLMREFVL